MKTIITLLFMIVCSNAVAAWTSVGNDQDVFVDLDTIQRSGSNLNVWVVTNFKTNDNGVPRQVSMKKLKEVACQSGTSRLLDAIIKRVSITIVLLVARKGDVLF